MGKLPMTDKEEFSGMETDNLSDFELICHVRNSLVAVTQDGDTDNYDELVGYLYTKTNLTPDEAALLVTTLNALSRAVSHIDDVHHRSLLSAVSNMCLWNYGTEVTDALLELMIELAIHGILFDWSLDTLVRNFVPPPYLSVSLKSANGVDRKNKVLSQVHAALKQIADVMPITPFRLSEVVVKRMHDVFMKQPGELVIYVENMLRLESGAMGDNVSSTMLRALVDILIELDVQIGWDGVLQEDARGIFEMELEDIAEFAEEVEKYDSMASTELYKRNNLKGNSVVENLDSLMELTFLHLESSQNSGRLAEVFNVLLASFERTVLNAYKSKFTQFVMFYACALDPEGCGVKFATVLAKIFESRDNTHPPITRMSAVAYLASYLSRAKFLSAALVANILQGLVDWCFKYCKSYDVDMNPEAHQVFYSGCQAIMYVLCFRMGSLLDVPRLRLQLLNMPMEVVWKHKLNPLKVCLPTVVEEFLKQAKAARLFMKLESFVFNDFLESDLSKAFGGMHRLDMFFPFDPCLLKKSQSYIKPHFVHWSRVRTTYIDGDDEVSDSGSEASDDDFVGRNEAGFDFDPDLNKMSITPKKSFKFGGEAPMNGCMRMPARIRPSTSPESL